LKDVKYISIIEIVLHAGLAAMRVSFRVAYSLYKGKCILAEAFREAVRERALSVRGDELVGRLFGVRIDSGGESIEGCIRVSYKQRELLTELMREFSRRKISYSVVYRSKGNFVLWFKHGGVCDFCPLIHAVEGAVPKTMLVTPLGLLFEFILCDREWVGNSLFEVLASRSAQEMMDYMLTPREQEVIYYAYTRGYFDQPHGATLDQIAAELKLSKSSLHEILRSATRKIITAYMRHDLPHLVVSRLLDRGILERRETTVVAAQEWHFRSASG
jgi:AraC-like DNA-binding protein